VELSINIETAITPKEELSINIETAITPRGSSQ
jgi:hypothetical protein